ncbi:MAG: DUF1592 domain-containing protein [Planctomycetia bacterium]|nr:DUF1592 domain-containing protein [Planctomycetia bacterium]
MRNRDVLALLLVCGVARSSLAAEPPAPVANLIEKHCVSCHDAKVRKGNLDLTALKADFTDRAVFDRWVRVLDRVAAREMPPVNRVQPTAPEREALLKSLNNVLAAADGQRQQERGRVPLRRLTRTEYEYTIRDLFAMPGLAVKDLLPEDGQFGGFDKSSAALDISAVHLRKYLEAADAVLDAAIVHQDRPAVYRKRVRLIGALHQFGEAVFPISGNQVEVPYIKELKKLRLPERIPHIEKMESLGMLTSARPSFEPGVGDFSPFHSGYYRLRTKVWSFHIKLGAISATDRVQSLALTANNRVLAYLDAPPTKPLEHEMVVWLNAGERLQLNPANLWPSYRWVPGYDGPAVAVDWFDVEGPLNDAWPPASHRRLFGNLPLAELSNERGRPTPRVPAPVLRFSGARPNHNDGKEFQKNQPVWTAASPRPKEDAERLLREFLPRAFRRPVAPEEIEVYVKLAHEHLDTGEFFESAMRAAYRLALCAPDFLFLMENPRPNSSDPLALDSYALASRLSYFLWNSQPDQELLNLAAKGQLGGRLLLDQVERMLADPRSDRFVQDFLDQWLKLRDIDATSPDGRLYPEFRPELRDAMLAETRAYFRELVTKNLGAAHIVDADFLTINQRLAEHYGIPGVSGSAIRRVPRPEGSPRGGFLTQGAVLKVTANGTSTSPVLRGVWVLDRVLGKPPQPPPPDIAAIDPDLRGTTTVREQLDKHRSNAVCASCHSRIDPPGFALESFDVIGGWRTRYRHMGDEGDFPEPSLFLNVPANTKLEMFRFGLPVDASGATAEGQPYQDIVEFKKLLLASEEQIARNLLERLIHYATGAPVTFTDRAQVERMLKASAKDRHGVRTLIQQVVTNPIFTRK